MTNLRLYLIGAGVIARYHAAACAKLPDAPNITLYVETGQAQVIE